MDVNIDPDAFHAFPIQTANGCVRFLLPGIFFSFILCRNRRRDLIQFTYSLCGCVCVCVWRFLRRTFFGGVCSASGFREPLASRMQTTPNTFSVNSVSSQRTVWSVMHEPPPPPYRRLEPQDQQQHPQYSCNLRQLNTGGFGAFSCDGTLTTKTSREPKKDTAPIFMTNSTQLLMEAAETVKELNNFERSLGYQRRSASVLPNEGRRGGSILDAATGDLPQRSFTPNSMDTTPSLAQRSPRALLSLSPRILSELLLRNNLIVSRLLEIGQEKVLQHMEETGRRVGMRTVTSQELFFLLSCIFDEKTLWKNDVEYLFRFFDWGGKGSMEFKYFLASASLLFVPTEVQIAVQCRRVLSERVLDDSVISVTDIDLMLASLTNIFASVLPEVSLLCDEVRMTVGNVMPTHTVPLAAFRNEINRISTLKRCVSAVGWNGSIKWSEVLLTPLESNSGATHLERQMNLVNTAIAEGRESSLSSVSVQSDDYLVDVSHPRFVADKYLVRQK
ncbi:pyrroline-5-carboxylate reductase, putative [Trypanosoma cruzi marinkellei]|uniref:Pyrroline-5-carboxylate reductase, putative n=1 Tax=Trypanosoma cruzi marinkellei TaxID=85056 RepID=K2MJW2_TRYCR|nr:pyrroline-5-carboxylate reductase, putative [Trypanosoma cruzi marinkellei]